VVSAILDENGISIIQINRFDIPYMTYLTASGHHTNAINLAFFVVVAASYKSIPTEVIAITIFGWR
jgi:hypothetical protein